MLYRWGPAEVLALTWTQLKWWEEAAAEAAGIGAL
jgi:hypothetical protein